MNYVLVEQSQVESLSLPRVTTRALCPVCHHVTKKETQQQEETRMWIRVKQSVPKSVESVIAAVDLDGNGAGVGFGHASVSLHDDELGPDFVVDLVPFVQNLLDVILQREK